MDIVNSLIVLMKSPKTWIIFIVLVLFAWGFFGRYMRRMNISKGKALLIGVVALGLSLGGASLLGVGTISSSSGVSIVQLQTTTAYSVSNTTSNAVVTDTGFDDTKLSDFYVDEGDINSDAEIGSGVFMVTRGGTLDPASCLVKLNKPPVYKISNTEYQIVNEDSMTGVMTAYVHTGTSSAVATGADPKEKNMLAFDRGVATGYVSFNISLDETGFDPLTQYDYKDITANICGYKYTWRVHKADA